MPECSDVQEAKEKPCLLLCVCVCLWSRGPTLAQAGLEQTLFFLSAVFQMLGFYVQATYYARLGVASCQALLMQRDTYLVKKGHPAQT